MPYWKIVGGYIQMRKTIVNHCKYKRYVKRLLEHPKKEIIWTYLRKANGQYFPCGREPPQGVAALQRRVHHVNVNVNVAIELQRGNAVVGTR